MPVISCPSCQGKLRFPDDSPPRRVKCPTCGHVFQGRAGPAPAGGAARAARDDEDDDRRRGRNRRDEDDDRWGRRRRDDDEDDRDRRSRRRDDDVDEADRDRQRRRDDDYYERRSRPNPRAVEGQFNRASVACLLCFIGGWLQVAALAVIVFVTVLRWAEVQEGANFFVIVSGLIGLGNLLASAVGYGFLVSGPRDRGALGLAIATAAVAGFHLILVLVIATTSYQNPRDQVYSGVNWFAFVTEFSRIPQVFFWVIAAPPGVNAVSARVILPVFASLAEVARVILFLLTLRAVMRCARDPQRARTCMHAVLAVSIGFGAMVFLGVLFGLLAMAVRDEQGGWTAVTSVFSLALLMVQAGLVVWTTLVTKGAKDAIDYRPD